MYIIFLYQTPGEVVYEMKVHAFVWFSSNHNNHHTIYTEMSLWYFGNTVPASVRLWSSNWFNCWTQFTCVSGIDQNDTSPPRDIWMDYILKTQAVRWKINTMANYYLVEGRSQQQFCYWSYFIAQRLSSIPQYSLCCWTRAFSSNFLFNVNIISFIR